MLGGGGVAAPPGGLNPPRRTRGCFFGTLLATVDGG